VLEAGDELGTTAELVTIEGNPLAVDEVVRRPGRNRAAIVTRDRATAGVAHARHWHAMNLEVGGTAADHLAAVGGGIAQPDDVSHWSAPV
jgi:hypothetical protein